MEDYEAKTIAVTGCAGTIGQELIERLARLPVKEVRGLDHNEAELFFMQEKFGADDRLRFFLSDIRDLHDLELRFNRCDYVFHAAALKHVPLCELSPFNAVQTNIIGTENVILAARNNNVKRVLYTSSDKAVNPTNVMGTSKLMAERLITAANISSVNGTECVYNSTRFGNVAGSRGSVVELFTRQIFRGGPVTLTDKGMTRFIMTLDQAVSMIMESLPMGKGGEVFVTKMPVIRIVDLARVMVELLAPLAGRKPGEIEIVEIGAKPGEKFYEELLSLEETRRTLDLGESFVILPAIRDVYQRIGYEYNGDGSAAVTNCYVSSNEEYLSEAMIRDILLHPKVLPGEIRKRLTGAGGRG